jgi:DNA-binding MarR family transcriptional regulator
VEKYIELIDTMICIINKINEMGKKPKNFGTGHLLYQSEIHTIHAIGKHEGANSSELAQILGITKGAVTQVISKLVQKNLVEKYKTNNNKKEVYLKLTPQGEIANKGHDLYHEKIYKEMVAYLDGLEDNEIQIIMKLFDDINLNLTQK